MFVSYKWLSEYVDVTGVTAHELAELITKSGIEVEGVEVLNKGISGVVVGHVLECEQHPNADKLNKCLVDLGQGEPVQIICGASNVAKGQKVAVATVGAVLPGNFKIKKAKLRGEESNGMICSLQELGVEGKLVPKEFSEGIYVFPHEVEAGEDALLNLNLDDQILELSLTPNRADCLNMLGVAYEVAAILDREVKFPTIEFQEGSENASDYITVNVEANEDNPLYVAKIVKDVKVGPSPYWMQSRLMAAGIRPISNIVDITNYILLEYGQPLHAFDYDRIGSKEILVRRAKAGEKIVTLDDVERTASEDHLLITNGQEPLALAGVMGGATSEVHADTRNVLIESAYFASGTIRKASKEHGLRSEASARYEKGIDPKRTHEAAERAAQLMAEYAGGTVLQGSVEVNTLTLDPAVVTITLDRINRVIGTELTSETVADIFRRLKFEYSEDNGEFTITVPTRRGDITIEEDIVEEVARLYGYDHLPVTLPAGEQTPGSLTVRQKLRRQIRRYFEGAGLYQATTYSLTSKEKVHRFLNKEERLEPVELLMPMSEDRSVLRLSLVSHLTDVLKYNLHRQVDQLGFYEVGSVFIPSKKGELPNEVERIAGAVTGLWHAHLWQGEKKPVDFYVVKGILDGLFDSIGVDQVEYQAAERNDLHPGRTAHLFVEGDYIGYIGQVHPSTQKELDLQETYVFELSLDKLATLVGEKVDYHPVPRYPSISRDIALVVDKEITAGDIQKIIVAAGGTLLKDVHAFDLYEGEKMEEGKKSIAFSLRYFDPERTLTDDVVVPTHDKVLAAVEEKTGAVLRG
ncbi:phenylalanine--tRNA ligase subunit beta [Bacillus pinisoli]|uniref:phenylalanine--tRNA ligase subunit beta n=1 Tax=Bacillus pinisoli TaxID=2901866 RepID=UPI001FF5E9AC|nr:phenylalanine--tRNA ligase subunit beta [Bacillus pinisoli]